MRRGWGLGHGAVYKVVISAWKFAICPTGIPSLLGMIRFLIDCMCLPPAVYQILQILRKMRFGAVREPYEVISSNAGEAVCYSIFRIA